MNLLLLLSAMLSALTGIGGSARVPAAATIAAKVEVVRAARDAAVAPASRPLQAVPRLAALARVPVALVPMLAVSQPLYASRRRE